MIIRGNANKVNVTIAHAKELAANGYRWSGHTHPGISDVVLFPSNDDIKILKMFSQEKSVTYNATGLHYVFGKE